MSIGLGIAVYLAGILFFLFITIYFYLLIKKVMESRYREKKKRWLTSHKAELLKLNLPHAAPQSSLEVEAIQDYFSNLIKGVKLSENQREIVFSRLHSYFHEHYRRNLSHRSWSVRMNTLYYITLFQMVHLQDELLSRLQHPACTKAERYQIYLTLACLNHQELDQLLEHETDLPPFIIRELMSEMIDPHSFEAYIDRFYTLPSYQQESVLEVIREKNFRSWKLLNLLEAILESPSTDGELRIKALKGIAEFGLMRSPERLLPHLNLLKEKGWVEKVMLARLMGAIRKDFFLPYLQLLIADESYQVRFDAAKSIRRYRKKGEEILTSILLHHPDMFARNMAEEWLERSSDDE